MEMLKTGVFWTFDVFWSLLLFFAHHKRIKTHYVLHILGHGIVSLSLLNYCLLTLTHIYQDVTKMLKRPPFGASQVSGERSYEYLLLTYHLLLTYVLLTYYLLFYLLLNQDVSKIAPAMPPRNERSERSTFVLRTYYVLITYLLVSLLLARYVRGTCFALAWCLHGSCVAFSTHFCVCLYVCHVFSMCLRVSSNFHLIALPVPLSVRFSAAQKS